MEFILVLVKGGIGIGYNHPIGSPCRPCLGGFTNPYTHSYHITSILTGNPAFKCPKTKGKIGSFTMNAFHGWHCMKPMTLRILTSRHSSHPLDHGNRLTRK